MADKIQIRRDTAANWTSANPTLAQGEIGFETDQNKAKIGDGSTAWTSLAYFAAGASITVDDSPTDGDTTDAISSNWAYDHANGADPHSGVYEPADATILKQADVDDTPVDAATTVPVSSNWAYDHAASTAATGVVGHAPSTTGASDGDVLTVQSDGSLDYETPVTGTGDVTGPGTSTENYVPQWDTTDNVLKDGLAVVTSVGSPGADTNLATEAAIRAAISTAGGGDVSGPASSTDGNFAVFSGTSGKTLADTGVSASDFDAAGTAASAVSTHEGEADPHTVYMLESEMGTSVTYDVPSTGDAAAGEVVLGNDSRLTDARTPTSHTHDAASGTAAGFAPITTGSSDGDVLTVQSDGTVAYETPTGGGATVEDTATDGNTTVAISSNWAYDHSNSGTHNGSLTVQDASSNQIVLSHDTGAAQMLVLDSSGNPADLHLFKDVDATGENPKLYVYGYDANQASAVQHLALEVTDWGVVKFGGTHDSVEFVNNLKVQNDKFLQLGEETDVHFGYDSTAKIAILTVPSAGEDAENTRCLAICENADMWDTLGLTQQNDPTVVIFGNSAGTDNTENMSLAYVSGSDQGVIKTEKGDIKLDPAGGDVLIGTATALHDANAAMLKTGTVSSGQCDLSTGQVFDITVSGATTISTTNEPTSRDAAFLIRMTNGGSATVTWPTGITWPGGSAPTLTASGLDHIYLLRKSAGGFTGSYDLDVKTA